MTILKLCACIRIRIHLHAKTLGPHQSTNPFGINKEGGIDHNDPTRQTSWAHGGAILNDIEFNSAVAQLGASYDAATRCMAAVHQLLGHVKAEDVLVCSAGAHTKHTLDASTDNTSKPSRTRLKDLLSTCSDTTSDQLM